MIDQPHTFSHNWSDRWSREGLVGTDSMRCRWCGTIVQASFIGALEHAEKTQLWHGERISPCDAKRISSDGP